MKQIKLVQDYSGALFFAWEDGTLLTKDELIDIEFVYNLALVKQFADSLE